LFETSEQTWAGLRVVQQLGINGDYDSEYVEPCCVSLISFVSVLVMLYIILDRTTWDHKCHRSLLL